MKLDVVLGIIILVVFCGFWIYDEFKSPKEKTEKKK